MKQAANDITQLLLAWGKGDQNAFDALVPLVYDELRKLARNYMRGQPAGHTLQTTALVNEAYLRLIDSSRVNWQNRTHFFAVSAQLMRRVLVDFARAKASQKRGGERIQITLDEKIEAASGENTDLVALDEALQELAKLNARQSQIVELRYFGGLSEEEIAETLKISTRTVRRDWSIARAWLYRKLSEPPAVAGG
jgi:RNA polymerase sigma factor (TIGR02999 family)